MPKLTEIESRLIVSRGWGREEGRVTSGCGASFEGDVNILELAVMVA